MATAMTDWQPKFELLHLLIQLELEEDDNTKIVELHEVYKFVNWSLGWFGLDLKLQSSKLVYLETEMQFQRSMPTETLTSWHHIS
jgi:hypothetical protein